MFCKQSAFSYFFLFLFFSSLLHLCSNALHDSSSSSFFSPFCLVQEPKALCASVSCLPALKLHGKSSAKPRSSAFSRLTASNQRKTSLAWGGGILHHFSHRNAYFRNPGCTFYEHNLRRSKKKLKINLFLKDSPPPKDCVVHATRRSCDSAHVLAGDLETVLLFCGIPASSSSMWFHCIDKRDRCGMFACMCWKNSSDNIPH
jgi:hypothetical protein